MLQTQFEPRISSEISKEERAIYKLTFNFVFSVFPFGMVVTGGSVVWC